jgi:hypothetical protein
VDATTRTELVALIGWVIDVIAMLRSPWHRQHNLDQRISSAQTAEYKYKERFPQHPDFPIATQKWVEEKPAQPDT